MLLSSVNHLFRLGPWIFNGELLVITRLGSHLCSHGGIGHYGTATRRSTEGDDVGKSGPAAWEFPSVMKIPEGSRG